VACPIEGAQTIPRNLQVSTILILRPSMKIWENLFVLELNTIKLLFTALRVGLCIARTMPWQDVRLSVRPSHAGIQSKRLYVSSKFFHHRVAPPF